MDQLGSYRLRKRLAVGGMGEVYLGEKIGPEGFVKPVVLKCVLPQLANDRSFVQLFLDEARLAALLNHNNIAQIYDFGLVDEIYYIAMEYVPGYTVDDLRRKLKSIGQHMPLEHVASIASQVCQGLHHAHALTDAKGVSLGLVHRDVSPHNLIVSVDGSVKIVDFGIAKARAGLTRVQAKGAVGKLGYMSPEQAKDTAVDGRSDVFSLGVCMWELATSERLHDPNLDRPPEYSSARPVRSIEAHRTEVPRQFLEILETSLAVRPEDRYPSAQAMHLALERFLAAMTHYAGQSALAQYIKDLVEGRIENPQGVSGEVVEPAGKKRDSGQSAALQGAMKYEEVFGVTMESKEPPRLRSVPKSWETRPSRRTPLPGRISSSPGAASDAPNAEAAALGGPIGAGARDGPRTDRPFAPRRGPSRGIRVGGAVAVAVVLAAGGYLGRERLRTMIGAGSSAPAATSVYRIETDPEGAEVLLDGEPLSEQTPVEVKLVPEREYKLTVRKEGHATRHAVVRAAAGGDLRVLPFRLPVAAALSIESEPPGARVSIGGFVVADKRTPMTLEDLPAGEPLRVTVELEGRPPEIRTVTLPKGKKRHLKFTLSP